MNKVSLLIGRNWIPPGQWSGIQKGISSSQKAACCRRSTTHPTVCQRRFYFPRTRGDGHTPTCGQVSFDKFHSPHIVVNPKWYLTWKACASCIDLQNERHSTVSVLWASQSEEVPGRAVQLLPLSPSEKSTPRLSDQAMCFSQNDERLTQRIIPEMFRRWIIRTILLPLKTAIEGLEIFEIRDFILYPFQDLNLLSRGGNADDILYRW